MQSLIRLDEVERRTTHSRSEIYKRMRAGKFPRPVKLSRRVMAWVEQEVNDYVETQIAARDDEQRAK